MSLNEEDIGKTEDTRHVEESGLDESDESLPMVSLRPILPTCRPEP